MPIGNLKANVEEGIEVAEIEFLKDWFDENDIDNTPDIYLLKDFSGENNYILAFTDEYYAIMRRKTFTITEHASGDDSNPYRGYLNNELYYAGPMSYIVKQGSDYYNIRIKEVLSDEALRLLSDRMNMFEQKDRNELVANSYRNTFKALYEGGEVNVTTKSTIRATTQAMVEVEDSSLTAIQSNSKTSTVDKFNDTEYYINDMC